MIENLNQLKRALRPGIRLQIVDHRRTECINQLREVTWITSNGFCTKVLNQPADKIDAGNNGRGAMLWWGPASTWTFENGECSSFTYGGNRKETLIIAFRVLNEEVYALWQRNLRRRHPAWNRRYSKGSIQRTHIKYILIYIGWMRYRRRRKNSSPGGIVVLPWYRLCVFLSSC